MPIDHIAKDLVLIGRLIRRILHFVKFLKGARHLQADSRHTIQWVIGVDFLGEFVQGEETGWESDEKILFENFWKQIFYLRP